MKPSLIQTLLILIIFSLISCIQSTNQNREVKDKSWQRIHEEAVVVDGHNDFLYFTIEEYLEELTGQRLIDFGSDLTSITHLDLKRQKEGGLDVQVFSVWCPDTEPEPYKMALRLIDSLEVITQCHKDQMTLVYNSEELTHAIDKNQSIAMIGVEGGHMIEDDLGKLDTLHQRGARYMTLTWNNSTSWATSSYDEQPEVDFPQKGLSDFGRQVVQRMNELGMLVDISHVGEQTFWDVMETTTKPVIASHSSAYTICPWHRNLKDEQLRAIGENNGLVMVNFYPGYIDTLFWDKEIAFFDRHKQESDSIMEIYGDGYYAEYILYKKYKAEADSIRPPLSKLIDHIDYIVELIGVDHVGLGSDFDGITINPQQLDDVSDFPQITKALLERGYPEEDVKKIMGGNFLRVLRQSE
jgi:membrane dipeptidase